MDARTSSQLLAFRVMEHAFVLDVRRILELLRAPAAVAVPGTHPAIRGLLLWRGRSIPLLSLRQVLFGQLPAASERPRLRAIVLEAQGHLFALEVDNIDDVVVMRPQDVLDAGQLAVAQLSSLVLGCCLIDGRQYLLLDIRPLSALLGAPAPLPKELAPAPIRALGAPP